MGKNAKKSANTTKKQLTNPENKLLKKKIHKFNTRSKAPPVDTGDDTDTETRNQKTEVFLEEIHKVFQELNTKNPDPKNRVKEYILEKLCEKCMDPNHDHLLLLCDVCDDAYHTFCLDPPLKCVPPEDEEWICPPCVELKKIAEQPQMHEERQTTLDEHFRISAKENIRMCAGCEKKIEDIALPVSKGKPSKKKTKEICVKCQKFYHPACFNTRSSSILCSKCETFVKTNVPKTDKTLFDFYTVKPYKIVNRSQSQNSKISTEKVPEITTEEDVEYVPVRRLSTPYISPKKARLQKTGRKIKAKKKKTLFKLPKLSADPKVLFTQKTLLAGALISKNITFDDDLCFSNPKCPPQSNNTDLEPNLQKMDPENLVIFKKFKEMTRNGNYAPMYVIEDKVQGFIVQAAEDIPIYTLISEYVGEVDFARNRLFDKNDSIMDLLRTTRSSTSLVICPESRGNIARFLSGINNSDRSSRQKQNVCSIRYNIEGHARVLLYASRNIKAGETLYYDYNAGGFNGYPTEDFV